MKERPPVGLIVGKPDALPAFFAYDAFVHETASNEFEVHECIAEGGAKRSDCSRINATQVTR